jgi:tRNA-specific 2-thiouridylase
MAPGDVVDADSGAVVAQHDGAYAFTIGQRRGLNLRVPAEDGSPRYVVDVDVVTRTVTVGAPELLDVDVIEGIRPLWAGKAIGEQAVEVLAQVRAHGTPVGARARSSGDRVVVELGDPIRGLAPGQAVVLYDGTRVIGSATVDATRRVTRP